jgi:hypothetical protein
VQPADSSVTLDQQRAAERAVPDEPSGDPT